MQIPDGVLDQDNRYNHPAHRNANEYNNKHGNPNSAGSRLGNHDQFNRNIGRHHDQSDDDAPDKDSIKLMIFERKIIEMYDKFGLMDIKSLTLAECEVEADRIKSFKASLNSIEMSGKQVRNIGFPPVSVESFFL